MLASEALRILTDATERCRSEDMHTPQVIEALKTLLGLVQIRWCFQQHYWRALPGDHNEGRWQEANASYNAVVLAVERATGTS